MSGGGSSKPKAKTDTAVTQPMQTVQPGMPGQIDALSQQLAAGFGQQPADIMSQLMQYYQPMSLPNYAPPAATPTPTTPTPTTPATPKPTKLGIVKLKPETDMKTGAYNPIHSGGANR